jgi:hypothetical protein
VDLASHEDQERFQKICRSERKQLRRHTLFLLTSPFFGRRERIVDLLMAFGLYRALRPVFSREK